MKPTDYSVRVWIRTERPLTAEQLEAMRAEVQRVVDDEANLPLGADVMTATAKEITE